MPGGYQPIEEPFNNEMLEERAMMAAFERKLEEFKDIPPALREFIVNVCTAHMSTDEVKNIMRTMIAKPN